MIVALFLAAAFAGADPTPPPAPETTFPEIGRVRSLAPPCTAMKDIVIPSWEAAKSADKRFELAQSTLPKYAATIDDDFNRWGVQREMQLSKIDQTVSNMMANTLTINKLLGDPRISAKSPDPQVQAERAALIEMYQTQQARISILNEFISREKMVVMTHDLGGAANSALGAKGSTPDPEITPQPGSTRSPWGQPSLNGVSMQDSQFMKDWTGQMVAEIKISEERAAKTFYPIAAGCR
jgi:hypothetical protein